MSKSDKNSWSGELGFILASIGAAVGLGNIWRFPYLVGESGGGAFILLYLIFVFCIGVPIMIAEIVLGRHAKTNLIDGLEKIAIENKKSKHLKIAGWFSLFTLFIILVFYSIVSGWILYYLKQGIGLQMVTDKSELVTLWSGLLADYKAQILYYTLFVLLTLYVIGKGVQNGLEKLNAILMPALFLILILLVAYSATLTEGFYKTVQFLFVCDFSKITSKVVVQALGQAFFSMAVGAGAMFMYGSYLPKKVSITKSVFIVAIVQFLVGILAGFAIFPIIFEKSLPLEFGPGLMFIAIPSAFAGTFMSDLKCISFFVLLLFAAITSSVNIGEPLVSTLCNKLNLSKRKACFIIFLLLMLIGIPAILSFGVLSEYKIFNYNIFDSLVNLSTNILLPLGGIFYSLCAGFVLKKHIAMEELGLGKTAFNLWYYSLRYVIPLALGVLLFTH